MQKLKSDLNFVVIMMKKFVRTRAVEYYIDQH